MSRLVRRVALLTGLLVLIACIAVVVAALAGPRVVSQQVARIAQERGGTAELRDLTLGRSGHVRLSELIAEQEGVAIRCSGIRIAPSWRAAVRGQWSVSRIDVEQCTITRARGEHTPGSSDADAETRALRLPPVHAELERAFTTLGERVAVVHIGRVEFDDAGVQMVAEPLEWREDHLSTTVRTETAAARLQAALSYEVGASIVLEHLQVDAPAGVGLTADQVRWERDGTIVVERPDVRAAMLPPLQVGEIRWEQPEGTRPALRLTDVELTVPRLPTMPQLPAALRRVVGEPGVVEQAYDGVRVLGQRLQDAHGWLERVPDLPFDVSVEATVNGLEDDPFLVTVVLGALSEPAEAATRVISISREPGAARVRIASWPFASTTARGTADLDVQWVDDMVLIGATLDPLVVQHEAVARDAMSLGPVVAQAAVSESDDAMRIDVHGQWRELPWEMAVEADASDRTLELRLAASEAWSCASTWEAIPAALLPQLGHDAMAWSGEFQPELVVRAPADAPRDTSLEVSEVPGDCRVDAIEERWDPAQLLADDWTMQPREGVDGPPPTLGPGASSYVSIRELPAYLPALMYLSEEVNFPTNPGVALGLIERGLQTNLAEGRYVYGGSSISQQLVKNLFLRREKTVARKLEELVLTHALERTLPKWRILELYLNCIEFGPDVWGIAAASEYYFDRDASELTPLEAAFLATLKPAPSEGATYRQRGRSNTRGWWPERLELLLRRLVEHGGFIASKEVDVYAPYVVALRRDFDDEPGVLGDGEFERIERPPWVTPYAGDPPWGAAPAEPSGDAP